MTHKFRCITPFRKRHAVPLLLYVPYKYRCFTPTCHQDNRHPVCTLQIRVYNTRLVGIFHPSPPVSTLQIRVSNTSRKWLHRCSFPVSTLHIQMSNTWIPVDCPGNMPVSTLHCQVSYTYSNSKNTIFVSYWLRTTGLHSRLTAVPLPGLIPGSASDRLPNRPTAKL